MKPVKRLFDKARPHFEEGGKWAGFYPVFLATETFFFFPKDPTKASPHIRDSLDLKRFMSFVILALLPPFVFGIYNSGYQAFIAHGTPPAFFPVMLKGISIVLPLVVVSYAVGLFWEGIFAMVRRHEISEGFFVTGLLYPLTLPPTMPLWQAAVGISFGVVIGKEVFGGTGRNILNPALTARAFVFFAYPASMSGDSVWTVFAGAKGAAVDAFTSATPLAVSAMTRAQESIETALMDSGYSFSTLFFGLHPGSIGETSAFLCFLGGLFLIVTGIASYRTILGGIAGLLATGFLVNILAGPESASWLRLNPFYHLVMGGFAFGIVYMATDPVSSPGMETSRWIYGFMIGALTIMIRVFNPAYPEGVMLSILFMNLFAPLLDHFEVKFRIGKRIQHVG